MRSAALKEGKAMERATSTPKAKMAQRAIRAVTVAAFSELLFLRTNDLAHFANRPANK